MTTLYEFSVHCTTDGDVGGIFGYADPTECPINSEHEIDGVSIIRVVESDQVVIREEEIPTANNREYQGYTFDVPAGSVGDISSFEIPVEGNMNDFCLHVNCETENKDDTFDMYIDAQDSVGLLTQDISVDDEYVYLDGSSIEAYKAGYTVAILDGSDVIKVGRISAVLSQENRVLLRSPSTVAIVATGSTVAYRWITRGTNIPLSSHSVITLGFSRIMGSYIPKDSKILLFYKNNTVDAKKFKFTLETTY